MSIMLFEVSNWLVAALTLAGVITLLWRVWHGNGSVMYWTCWLLSIVILVLLYLLKSGQLALDGHPFRVEWGIGRRWNDISHWFVVLLIGVAWVPALAASLLRLHLERRLRRYCALGVCIACVVYFVLVRIGDSGQTFFFPTSWLTGVKWIQVIEGVLILWIIAFAHFVVWVFLGSVREVVNRWKGSIPTAAALLTPYFGAMLGCIWSVLEFAFSPSVTNFIKTWVTPAMPLYQNAFKGPRLDLLAYQVVGLVLMPFLIAAFALVWITTYPPPPPPPRTPVAPRSVK